MPETELAIALSARDWPDRLRHFLADHGGARVRVAAMGPEDLLVEAYHILLIDDICSFLTPRLIDLVAQQGRVVLGVYDPAEFADGKDRLLECGVADVVEAGCPPRRVPQGHCSDRHPLLAVQRDARLNLLAHRRNRARPTDQHAECHRGRRTKWRRGSHRGCIGPGGPTREAGTRRCSSRSTKRAVAGATVRIAALSEHPHCHRHPRATNGLGGAGDARHRHRWSRCAAGTGHHPGLA